MGQKYLTKSLFKIGLECPRKLYYHEHPELYQNQALGDPFLEALAEGGFQVGALAKIYHPEGIDLSELYPKDAVNKTKELLNKTNVTIFEAAFCFENLLIRTDILVKNGNVINVFEVKSKSYDSRKDNFIDKRTKSYILSDWTRYIGDIAYQTYVCKNAYPNFEFIPFLTLINKNAITTVDGLNQKFLLKRAGKKGKIIIKPNTDINSVGDKILIDINMLDGINLILSDEYYNPKNSNWWDILTFNNKINELAFGLLNDNKLKPRLDAKCKKCEFRCEAVSPLASGFNECWSKKIALQDISEPFVFDVWCIKSNKSDPLLQSGKILMRDLTEDDFELEIKKERGLSHQQRQWLQVERASKNSEKYIDQENLALIFKSWQFPLHFIDFETATVAIPFNKGMRPYEQIAFQFSHHRVNENGIIEHIGQYINAEPGVFPNFEFVRALKIQLELDSGTIFRYSNHENTVLCQIIKQLENSTETDKEILISWIKTITKKDKEWFGKRSMVDLCDLVINCYYHPLMRGSNSLKFVLPAILQDSKFLQNKYQTSIYGRPEGIKSLNYTDWSWIKLDKNESVIDPYKLLPKLFNDIDLDKLDRLFEGDDIRSGGAAMTAYAKMQFTEMTEIERKELCSVLLKYCELDTFAMVLLYEYFLNEISLTHS